jgi:hypothetical protein
MSSRPTRASRRGTPRYKPESEDEEDEDVKILEVEDDAELVPPPPKRAKKSLAKSKSPPKPKDNTKTNPVDPTKNAETEEAGMPDDDFQPVSSDNDEVVELDDASLDEDVGSYAATWAVGPYVKFISLIHTFFCGLNFFHVASSRRDC